MDLIDLNELRSIEELSNYQKEVRSAITALNAEYSGLPFPDEAREQFADLTDADKGAGARIAELEKREQIISQYAEDPRKVVRIQDDLARQMPRSGSRDRDIWDLSTVRQEFGRPEVATRELHERARRAVEISHFPHSGITREKAQEAVEALLERDNEKGELAQRILITGSPTYRRAFFKRLAGMDVTPEEARALGLGTQGGISGVPYILDPTMIPTSNSSINPVRAIANVEQIVGSNEWRGVISPGVTAARVAEFGAATDNSPTLTQPTLTVTKAHVFIPISIEELEDYTRLEAGLAAAIQDSKDDEEATAFVTGSGAGVNPQGFVTGTTNTVAASTGLTVTAANLYALENALPPRFRPNEVFVANRGIYNVVRAIDTAGGAALWLYLSQGLNSQVPSPGNTGALLLGRPAYEASAMQATVVNATKIMVVGDFRYFKVIDRIGLSVELIPHLFGAAQGNLPTGQRGIYAWWRNTSEVLDPAAFRALTGTT